ncbi:MAG: hypothetical protein AMXMBFR53_00340 [Gemmatimonadota bacterium]
MSARERILARVRDALEERPKVPHPGAFRGGRAAPPPATPVQGFSDAFVRAGGEVVPLADAAAARQWLEDFARTFEGVAWGATVPEELRRGVAARPTADGATRPSSAASPEHAALGVSMALGAVAETGSLVLSSADGRRTQLLPPTHVVVVPAGSVHATLSGALTALRPSLPSALGLHSGPSKSADIGQILVRGVHGPGRVVALLLET